MTEAYKKRIEDFEEDIVRIEEDEKTEKELRSAENQMNRVKRRLDDSQPQEEDHRVWFQTNTERRTEKCRVTPVF